MNLKPQTPSNIHFFDVFGQKWPILTLILTKIGIFGLASSESSNSDKITSELDYLNNFTPKTDGTKLKSRPVNHPTGTGPFYIFYIKRGQLDYDRLFRKNERCEMSHIHSLSLIQMSLIHGFNCNIID